MGGNSDDSTAAKVRKLAQFRVAIEQAHLQDSKVTPSHRMFQRDFHELAQVLGRNRLEQLFDEHLARAREEARERERAYAEVKAAQEAIQRKSDAGACLYLLSERELAIIKALRRPTGLHLREILAHFVPGDLSFDEALWPQITSEPRWRDARAASSRELSRYIDLHASPDAGLSAKVASLLASARPNPTFLFGYRFHPVGQGLFTSGFVTRRSGPFHWVYDCGTLSERAGLKAALGQLHRALAGNTAKRAHLHLVAISHFDADHINGLLDLLRDFSVGTLLLPYLTPWERLLVALDENALAGSDFLAFLMAPTRFILEREGFRVDQILLVPPGGEEPAPPEDRLEGGEGEDEVRMPSEPVRPEPDQALGGDPGLANPRVAILVAGRALTIGRVWEFFPYNDAAVSRWAKMSTADRQAFCREAQRLADRLKGSDVGADRAGAQAALDDLKALYDYRLGGRGRHRNIISLFLYGGPLGRVRLWSARERHRWLGEFCGLSARRYVRSKHRFGQMMTGDGFLETPERLAAFDAVYRPYGRLDRGANFQVMHHGSKHNWCAPVAPTVGPLASLFSSEPSTHDHHPDSEVWRDFRPYYRRQIDMRHGWSLVGAFTFG